jgi:uncharacterized membrane protein YkoI
MILRTRAARITGVCMGLSLIAIAAETKISKSQLPAAVQKTAEEQSQGASVNGYSKDKEDGRLEYEVQMTSNGHSKDVTIAPDGQLLEIEEEVAVDSLPVVVKSGLQAKAGNGQITKVESLKKHGTLVAYEAQVRKANKHSEVQVGPNGEKLAHEE